MKLLLILVLSLLTIQSSLVSADDSCQCDAHGSKSTKCDEKGQCECKTGYAGQKCQECANPYTKGKSGKCKIREERILVATGFGGIETEIIDLDDPNFDCTAKLQPFPEDTWSATGGLIRQKPMICGGETQVFKQSFSQACYALQEDGSWKEEEATLSKGRMWYGSGSVVVNDELVIARGLGLDGMSTSIEVVGGRKTKARTLEDIELPHETHASCIVPWDADTFLVIGGNPDTNGMTKYSQKGTYFVNIKDKTVINGPDLKDARFRHACSEMIINGEEFIVVTGGHGIYKSTQWSTEFLSKKNFENDGWQQRPFTGLPVPMLDHQMVSSPDKKSVYTIGNEHSQYDKDIYRYSCPTKDIRQCQWNKIETKLKYGRERLVAFGIPKSLSQRICE